MILVITEKNLAAQKIADLLGVGTPEKEKVYSTPVYRFKREGEDWVIIGLKGHILEPDFPPSLIYKKSKGWQGLTVEGEVLPVSLPQSLPKPPFKKKKPFLEDGVELGAWKMEALPYLVWAPIDKLPKEKEIIRSLKTLAKKAGTIVIATDFDREGELIGADALSCVKEVNDTAPVFRARYSAITKEEITHAFTNMVALDTNLANAGASRRDIDLIWGAVLTRYLTIVKFAGYGNVRSSGRVQTPTLALIVARERERLAFVPEDYWVVRGSFNAEGEAFEATHETLRFKSEAQAKAVLDHVAGESSATVSSVEKKKRSVAAPAPFNTTSLMAAAAAEGLSPARTMRIAESLYMDGYISYPRVDNTVYPASLDLEGIVKKLMGNPAYEPHCRALLKKGPLRATKGKKETTDHPPIHPTNLATPDMLPAADFKLYNLVARRFLATLSDAAIVEGTKAVLRVDGETFIGSGDVLVAPGYRAIYPYGLKKDEELPSLAEGQTIAFLGASSTHKQTEPPARFSQGRLIQEMEKLGLGTKSTRHAIIERLYEVKYIQNDPIEPSQLGIAVCDALDNFAPRITDPAMTAELEDEMDSIAAGATSKEEVVSNSRKLLAAELDNLIPHSEEVREALSDAVAADAYVGKCPKCGKDLKIRASSKTRSMFIGCSGWPECEVTFPLLKGKIEPQDEPCPSCGMPQVKVIAFKRKPRIVCIDPKCPTNQEPDIEIGVCPNCKAAGKSAKLIAQRSPRTLKRFVRCENYEECNTGYPLPQYGNLITTSEVCGFCEAPMVSITTSRGLWKLCPNFDCPGKEKDKEAALASKEKKPAATKAGTTKAAAKTAPKPKAKTSAKTTAKGSPAKKEA
ncbi:MAG: DNA topoisomerase I [Eggerthellaceae bacterium]|nr:DNA topoisomerase I [Eggerthellaceae bacterium]